MTGHGSAGVLLQTLVREGRQICLRAMHLPLKRIIFDAGLMKSGDELISKRSLAVLSVVLFFGMCYEIGLIDKKCRFDPASLERIGLAWLSELG